MNEIKTDASAQNGSPVRSTGLLDKSELVAILEQHLAVTDEWGGTKLASWKYGTNVVVNGIDDAADAILDRLSNVPMSGTPIERKL